MPSPSLVGEDLPPLVIVHGLKGSHLREADSSCRRYVTLSQILNCDRKDVSLPLKREPGKGGRQLDDGLVPDGVAELHVCGLALSESYSPLVRALSSSRPVQLFAYDWRRELWEAGQQLEKFLEEVRREADGQAPQVACHSMGGLVTFPVMSRRPDLFHSVLFATCVLRPGVSFLPDVSEEGGGNYFGPFNKSLLTPRTWLSLPAPHHFWPRVGTTNSLGGPFLEEADGTPVPVDFHNLEDWRRLRLGPFHPRSGIPAEALDRDAEAFFAETLARAKAYWDHIVHDPNVNYPPICVLRSEGVQNSPIAFRRPSPGEPFDFGNSVSMAGDGRITITSALPPEGVPVLNVLTNKLDHADILTDIPNVRTLLDELIAEVNRRKCPSPAAPLQAAEEKEGQGKAV